MAIYVVMEPPVPDADDAATRAVLVRDGFSIVAFILPLVWLLWHRLWIEALLVFAASVALVALGETAGFGFAGAALSFLFSMYVGLEGAALRVNALRRRGWREWGAVEGNNLAEAEIRYLTDEDDHRPAVEPWRPAQASAVGSRSAPTGPVASGPVLGLLGYPGSR